MAKKCVSTKSKFMSSNKIIIFSLAFSFLFFFSATESYAQKKKKDSKMDEYFDESGGWKHRLWFGGTANPSFSSNSVQTQFFLELSPMMGIKVLENDDRFSVGPRVSFEYRYIKILNFATGEFEVVQPITYSFGAFARYKVLPRIFPHVEMEYQNRGVAIDTGSDIIIERETQQNYYVGAGYNSGGILGYEILLLYNLSEPTTTRNLPFDIRFGLTYKF